LQEMQGQDCGNSMILPKPQNIEELKKLVESREIEIMLSEDLPDGTTRLLILDCRRQYSEGEIYEIIV